jgi:hypothetical protein
MRLQLYHGRWPSYSTITIGNRELAILYNAGNLHGIVESDCRIQLIARVLFRSRCVSSRIVAISASRRRTASRLAQGSGGATLLAFPIIGQVGGLSRE